MKSARTSYACAIYPRNNSRNYPRNYPRTNVITRDGRERDCLCFQVINDEIQPWNGSAGQSPPNLPELSLENTTETWNFPLIPARFLLKVHEIW